jgi:hypothetical protein
MRINILKPGGLAKPKKLVMDKSILKWKQKGKEKNRKNTFSIVSLTREKEVNPFQQGGKNIEKT